MRVHYLIVVVLLVLPAMAENPETAAEISQQRARKILDAGIEALGGAKALQAIENITLKVTAELYPRLQMPEVDPPHEANISEETDIFDLKKSRLAIKSKFQGAGFRAANRIVLTGGEGQNFDLRNRTVTPITAQAAQTPQYQQYYRRLPNLLLQTALQRAMTLRSLGEDNFNGRKHNVITFVHVDGSQVALYFDAKSNLLSKYEVLYEDALTGPEASEIIYGEYRSVGGVKVPAGFTWRQAEDVIGKLKYDVQFNTALTEDIFDTKTEGFAKVEAPTPGPVSAEKLADGVFLVQNLGGGGYNVLAVDLGDGILAVEAPLSPTVSEQAIGEIKKAIPNKPIKYIAVTHHHSDHLGGLRAFIAEGATVVTTPGNKRLVEQMAAARLDDALARNPRKLTVETFSGKRTFKAGERTVELQDIGPNPHAKEMVVAYLPKEKIVFQGDLFFQPQNDAPVGAAQEGTVHFAKRVKELGWNVDKLAGVHGRVSTMTELAQSLQKSEQVETAGTGN